MLTGHQYAFGEQVLIQGLVDCGDWVEARSQGRAVVLEGIFIGYLNGLAMGRGVDIWQGKEAKTFEKQAYLWLDRYCRNTPLSSLWQGGFELADELTAGRFRAAAKCLPR